MLTDQSEWAVCGRSAGVVNMETARKQTVVVEVMALVGGHLLLPKVKLSKYIPADMSSLQKSAPDHCSQSSRQTSASSQKITSSNEDAQNVKAVIKTQNEALISASVNQQNSGKNIYLHWFQMNQGYTLTLFECIKKDVIIVLKSNSS